MRRALATTLACALGVSACSLAPPYQPPQIATAPAYREDGPWRAATPADQTPRGPWWTAFGDPLLDALEQQVDAANPTLAVAAARYDEARAAAAGARAGLYPQATALAGLSYNRQSDERPLRSASSPSNYGSNELGAAASYELDFWQSLRNQARAGEARAQSSAADLASARLGLEAEIAVDYLALRGLDADSALLARTVEQYRRALDLTQHLFEGKIVGGIDVARAETQLADAQAIASDIAGRRALLEHAVAVLIGESPDTFTLAPRASVPEPPEVPTGVPSDLLQRRPDIASAERQMAAANAEIGVARAAFYPSISLDALGGTQSTNLSLLSAGNLFWSVGPNLSLPLFNGGLLKAEESGAYARYRETAATYRATVLAAFSEVEDNLALLHWLGDEAASEETAVASARKTLELALLLYREGADSYLEVVTAQTPLFQAERQAIDLKTSRMLAAVGLVRALGGGWSDAELPPARLASRLAADLK